MIGEGASDNDEGDAHGIRVVVMEDRGTSEWENMDLVLGFAGVVGNDR